MQAKAVLLLAALAGCSGTTGGPVAETFARATAKSVVLPIVEAKVPGPEAQVITSCIIDNARTEELFSLARDIGVEAGTSTLKTVFGIAARPETLTCISKNGLLPL